MNIFSLIKKTTFDTLLVSVYFVFFTVQCIYNFDVTNGSFKDNFTQLKKANNKQQTSFSVAGQHQFHKKNIRLNKRFQPETLPAIVSTVSVPQTFFSEKNFSLYKEKVYTSKVNQTSLRGPPAVI
jgi:hypothetical protein